MKQKYILYDNTNTYENQDEIRQELFLEYAEELPPMFPTVWWMTKTPSGTIWIGWI